MLDLSKEVPCIISPNSTGYKVIRPKSYGLSKLAVKNNSRLGSKFYTFWTAIEKSAYFPLALIFWYTLVFSVWFSTLQKNHSKLQLHIDQNILTTFLPLCWSMKTNHDHGKVRKTEKVKEAPLPLFLSQLRQYWNIIRGCVKKIQTKIALQMLKFCKILRGFVSIQFNF